MKILKYLNLWHIFKKYWFVIILLITILPLFLSSLQESQKENDYSIVFKRIGEGIVKADETIYKIIVEKKYNFEKLDSIEEKIDNSASFLWDLFSSIWRYVWIYAGLFILLFKIISFFSSDNLASKTFKGFFGSILILGFLQILVSGVPFRGILLLFKTIFEFSKTLTFNI